ncbi:streptomycin 6-kinase [Pseudonocardia sediminis]|uniref:Streptomycin 6-kinase n=1 Tax=Pseudonocardia sediminis TaxID=1397368 RepID=A0A4Q7UWE5_PSEST|nr:aminoglycoside phosphotransferase family protein [Pseudonocardia sediminis]RZT85201.1 streptomycin 6-kinase [Pseudonocardia sediminis]
MFDIAQVPAVVREKLALLGARDWLRDLPDLVAGLEADWAVTVGTVYPDGTDAVVCEALDDHGRPSVLKLLVPRSDGIPVADEIAVLRRTSGGTCVTLLRSDDARGALLMERLGPSLAALGVGFGRRLEILTALAAGFWTPAPDAGLMTGAEKGRWLAGSVTRIWDELDRPCPEAAVEHALTCAGRRAAAHDDERAVLVHGDVHAWNALRRLAPGETSADGTAVSADGTGPGRTGGFVLVDPDGLFAEPEYDLGVLMREDPVELMAQGPHRRAHDLARATGCDPVAVWEWGVAERVATGLVATAIGLQPVGAQMLDAAATIAAGPDRDL